MSPASQPRATTADLVIRASTGTWRVPVGQVLRVGRHPSNDVVVRGEQVSRFHARICWDGDQPYLEDLSSRNGTFFESERLGKTVILSHGVQFRVGPRRFAVDLPTTAAAALLSDAPEDLAFFGERQREQRGVVRSQSGLHRLLLDFERQERTGCLRLAAGGEVASLTFCLGTIVGARHQGRRGLRAVSRIMDVFQASYRFSADFEASETALCLSVRDYLRRGHWATAKQHRRELIRRLTA